MGRMIELIFTRVYLAMLATGIFWALTFCGGILFGFGPASATIMSLYAEHGSDYKQYCLVMKLGTLYKENFRRANQVFYTFFFDRSHSYLWHVSDGSIAPLVPVSDFYPIGQFDFLIGGSPDFCSLSQASGPF